MAARQPRRARQPAQGRPTGGAATKPRGVAKLINAAWAADPDFGTLLRVASYAIRIDANAGNVGEWLVEQDAEVAVGDSARLEVLAAGVGT